MPETVYWGPVGGQERHAPHAALTPDTPQGFFRAYTWDFVFAR